LFDNRTAGLSEDLAECVMNRFAEANFARINNKAGFLMGIIRRANMDWKRHREMSKCFNIETYIEYPNI